MGNWKIVNSQSSKLIEAIRNTRSYKIRKVSKGV